MVQARSALDDMCGLHANQHAANATPLPAVCCENHDADDTDVYNFHANGFWFGTIGYDRWSAFVATNNCVVVAQGSSCLS